MSLRGVFDAGKCAVGLHCWSAESSRPGSCLLVRSCERCQQVAERIEHPWLDWVAVDDATCALARTCGRCQESERRIDHEWGELDYPADGRCEQRERCSKCGTWAEKVVVIHRWGPWEYREQHRSPIRTCKRCDLRMSAIADHLIEQFECDRPQVDDLAVSEMLERAEQQQTEAGESGDSSDATAFKQLQAFYDEQVADGTITAERQVGLTPLLAQLEQAIAVGGQAGTGQVRELMRRLPALLSDPSRPEPVPAALAGSRAEALGTRLRELYEVVVGNISTTNLTGQTGEAAMSTLKQLNVAREAIAATPPDGDVTKLEVESLRHAALDARRFSLREHLTFANPVWPSVPVTPDPSAVFYSGDTPVRNLLTPALDKRRLRCLLPRGQRVQASLRWEQLRQSAIAVFDLTNFARSMPPDTAAAVAAVTYELGIALTLGRAVMIVATQSQDLPFDVDVDPLRITGANADADGAALATALDQAVYGLQREGAGNSVERSVEHLRELFAAQAPSGTIQTLDVFATGVARDPIRARQLSDLALAYLDNGAPELLLPSWPGDYPDATAPRCFHVTPFGPAFETTTKAVSDACQPDTKYIRGDQVLDPDIVRSIWDEICTATHVVCDLTGLNPNVTLELGIVHALGRNVLVISQDEQPERYFRAVAKVRCHHYSLETGEGRRELDATLRRFLTASGSVDQQP